ncbi:MAG: PhnD/SsuA/transferrin family substrate-binding protein [Polyangiaceae bacterium]
MVRESREPSERASRIEPLTRLATGGMADIWLAREIGTAGMERFIVVKRLLAHLARDPDIVDMFVSEGRFVARLTHPNVVQIHGIGEDEEGYFLVMEYVAGCSASELLTAAAHAEVKIPPNAALAIAEQACRGAHAAHELRSPTGEPLGLVHRDISPHNLMLGPSGEVKLLDFGIAKATFAIDATRAGSVKGKQGYMSPEQCAGGDVDRRSDVFALGIVSWELFTGTRLFKRETEYATMHAIVSGDVRAATSVRPELPAALDGVLKKALATDVEQRFQTADAFRRELVRVMEESGFRASRDDLVSTMTELLGARLEERERALLEAAKTGAQPEPHALRAALVQPETSTPGPVDRVADGAATVVERRHDSQTPPRREAATRARSLTPFTRTPTGRDRGDATLIDARPATPHPPADVNEESDAAAGAADEAERPAEQGTSKSDPGLGTSKSDPGLGTSKSDPGLGTSKSDPGLGASKAGTAVATGANSGSRTWLVAVFGVVFVLVFVAIALRGQGSGSSSSGVPTATAAGPSGPALRFVVAPTVEAGVLKRELTPFVTWLGGQVGRPIELILADTYDHTGEMISEGRADFALMPPLLFVRSLAGEPRLQPLAVRLFDGSRASDGYLLVRDDGNISQASDLHNHTICYVDKASTTGFLLPRIWMRKNGLTPDRDMKSIVSGDHVAAMRDLLAGKCDAAAVYSGAFLTARNQGIAVGQLRVLVVTGRVPQDALVASPTLPKADVDALKGALLRFEPQRDLDAGRIGEVLDITGFAEFRTTEFDAIREAADREGLLPKPGNKPR